MTGLIEASISLDNVSRGKPNPEPYLRGLALLGLRATRALAVEDCLIGAQSAIRPIGRSTGLRLAGLHAAGDTPDAVVLGSLRELPSVVGL